MRFRPRSSHFTLARSRHRSEKTPRIDALAASAGARTHDAATVLLAAEFEQPA
jgi:hypothetical protein